MIRSYSIEPRHWWKALIQCETRQQQQQQLQPDRKTSAASAYRWGAGWRAGHQHRTCNGCNSDTRNNNRQQMGNFSLVKKGQAEIGGITERDNSFRLSFSVNACRCIQMAGPPIFHWHCYDQSKFWYLRFSKRTEIDWQRSSQLLLMTLREAGRNRK